MVYCQVLSFLPDHANAWARGQCEVSAKKPSLNTSLGDQRLKGDFRTTTNARPGGLFARTGSLSGHPSKQQPRSMLLDPVILR
ncbi:hypothetical protein J6590_037899 [Homalodisca vitripennis]|nr:hypothetical protein J6590_037899 [Homalodisca vitripennis]